MALRNTPLAMTISPAQREEIASGVGPVVLTTMALRNAPLAMTISRRIAWDSPRIV